MARHRAVQADVWGHFCTGRAGRAVQQPGRPAATHGSPAGSSKPSHTASHTAVTAHCRLPPHHLAHGPQAVVNGWLDVLLSHKQHHGEGAGQHDQLFHHPAGAKALAAPGTAGMAQQESAVWAYGGWEAGRYNWQAPPARVKRGPGQTGSQQTEHLTASMPAAIAAQQPPPAQGSTTPSIAHPSAHSPTLSAIHPPTMSDACLATAVPDPMETPMSARRSAGASFTPSPVIATTWPFRQAHRHAGTPGRHIWQARDGLVWCVLSCGVGRNCRGTCAAGRFLPAS